MATPKLNPSRSISVIPSDYCNIPNPALFIVDVEPAASAAGYIQLNGFELPPYGVKAGDILYDYTGGIGVTVTQIVKIDDGKYRIYHNSTLVISTGITVKIYNGEDDSTGCVLYVGQGGAVSVITEGGDDVVFGGIVGGTFFPVQVLKVKSDYTGASEILALR